MPLTSFRKALHNKRNTTLSLLPPKQAKVDVLHKEPAGVTHVARVASRGRGRRHPELGWLPEPRPTEPAASN